MRRVLLALTLLAAVSPVAAADRALIVGINDYPGITVDGVRDQRDLRGAVNDARKMAALASDALGFPKKNVVLLTEGKATRKGILAAIRRELVDKTKPGDRVLFYYAGHGAQIVDDSGDETEDGLDEVLVPHDAVAELGGEAPSLTGVVLDDEIDDLLAQLKGREVTVIVDACHSGTITRSALAARAGGPGKGYSPVRTITPRGPLKLSPDAATLEARLRHARGARFAGPATTRGAGGGPKLAVWTAVTSAQYALEDMSIGGEAGLFTSRFVRGLRDFAADLNGNGVITPSELLDYLRVETQVYCGKFDCLDQDPLPMLEAFDGYAGRPLAERKSGGIPVAMADTGVAAGDAVVRTSDASAMPTDLVPGRAETVEVVLESGASGRVGSALRIAVKSPVAGRLVVLDRRDDGTVVQLFPNAFSRQMGVSDIVEAGAVVRMPGDGAPFELVADAAGRGTVTALVVDPAVDVSALLAEHEDLSAVADAGAYASAFAGAVNRAIVFTPAGEEEALEAGPKAPAVARGEAGYEITP